MPVEQVHLHEVGALDSIIDIVGAVFAIEWFGADRIVVSPLNVGSGMVRVGARAVPGAGARDRAAARGVPIYASGPRRELLTPTGALLVTGYADAFGPRAADERRPHRLRRRRPRLRRHAERACACSWARRHRRNRTTERVVVHRVRDRRHEPADLRRADGSPASGRCARRVLRRRSR